ISAPRPDRRLDSASPAWERSAPPRGARTGSRTISSSVIRGGRLPHHRVAAAQQRAEPPGLQEVEGAGGRRQVAGHQLVYRGGRFLTRTAYGRGDLDRELVRIV